MSWKNAQGIRELVSKEITRIIRSDEDLALETLALESLFGDKKIYQTFISILDLFWYIFIVFMLCNWE